MPDAIARPARPRTIVYVDGFNLYFGSLSRAKGHRWLDLATLFSRLRPHDDIESVRYFTAEVAGTKENPEMGDRQAAYLRALASTPLVNVHLGRFKSKRVRCQVAPCDFEGRRFFKTPEEKRTDVNIALRMLDDAYSDRCDQLVLVTGDSDLVPAVDLVKARFPEKRVLVYIPARDEQRSAAVEIRNAADQAKVLPLQLIKRSQFSAEIQFEEKTITRPEGW